MRKLAVLGCTGSIGTLALQVAALHPERFRVTALTAHTRADALAEAVRAFRPGLAGLTGVDELPALPPDVAGCRFLAGEGALLAAARSDCDDVLAAVVGMAGLRAVLAALESGKRVLLANKEALVAGGALVTGLAEKPGNEPGPRLLPVDSEHSAIYQCIQASPENPPQRLFLTCSGGPFRTRSREEIRRATRDEALRHPTWAMGRKITVDSATLFNKALEIIEARWLFGMPYERIQVLVHPQSVVHSAVGFADGAVLAQLGTPDMRVPILYAMAYPDRLTTGAKPLDPLACGPLAFEPPDEARFPSLRMAREVLAAGGAAACVLNAANEVAVERFLTDPEWPMGRIFDTVEETLGRLGAPAADSLEAVLDADRRAREVARAYIDR